MSAHFANTIQTRTKQTHTNAFAVYEVFMQIELDLFCLYFALLEYFSNILADNLATSKITACVFRNKSFAYLHYVSVVC